MSLEKKDMEVIKTHFKDLDNILNGFYKGNLIVLGARPAMGKTTLAINFAKKVYLEEKTPVGFLSLCDYPGRIKTHVFPCIKEMSATDPFFVPSLIPLNILDLKEKIKFFVEKEKIQFAVIDYLQLITGIPGKAYPNRHEELSDITRLLKTAAMENNIAILCLSQISREVEERPGHRPMLKDLYGSGSIEQDADVVLFLLRREYYDPNDKPGQAELIISKNRNGRISSVKLFFSKEDLKFFDYIEPDLNNEDPFE